MPAPKKFFDELKDQLKNESDTELRDKILDSWLKAESEATEWDAEQWGFDSGWMLEIRDKIAVRAHRAHEKQEHSE